MLRCNGSAKPVIKEQHVLCYDVTAMESQELPRDGYLVSVRVVSMSFCFLDNHDMRRARVRPA